MSDGEKKLAIAGVLAGVVLLLVLAGRAILLPFFGGSITSTPSPFTSQPQPVRVQRPITPEQREAIRERVRAARAARERTH